LIDRDVDAYIDNRQTGLYSIQKYGHSDDVKVIGSPINPDRFDTNNLPDSNSPKPIDTENEKNDISKFEGSESVS